MRKKESLGTQMPGARDTGAGLYPLRVTVQLKSSLDLLLFFIIFLLCTHTHTHTHAHTHTHTHAHTHTHTEEWASKVALLKRNCFASVFEKYFELQAKGGEKSTAIVHYRDRETM